MVRILVLLVLAAAVIAILAGFKRPSSAQVKSWAKKWVLITIVGSLIFFAATGRLNGLFAFLGVALAYVVKSLPQWLRYAPYVQRLWQEYMAGKGQSANSQGSRNQGQRYGMSKAEAYEVLGLKPGATEEEIINAHRKLMQKNHPDRGGSDYLAAKINAAKKVLLNQ